MTLFDVAPTIVSTDHVVGEYRYTLCRVWDETLPQACFAMLNPSKARRHETDPTDTRVRTFTRDWGYGGYTIVNLAAYSSSNPDDLATAADPIGPENIHHFYEQCDRADRVIAAWGASYPKVLAETAHRTARWMRDSGAHVLGLTKNGDPRHPLFMPLTSRPILWSSL